MDLTVHTHSHTRGLNFRLSMTQLCIPLSFVRSVITSHSVRSHTCSSPESTHRTHRGALGLLGGLGRTPTRRTHTASRMENITSSSKPVPFLISAVHPPPLRYLSSCPLMSSSSFFSSPSRSITSPPLLLFLPVLAILSFLVSFFLSVFHKLSG